MKRIYCWFMGHTWVRESGYDRAKVKCNKCGKIWEGL
jgi:hypothetical protein